MRSIWVLILICLVVGSCKKSSDEKMPKATQSGENIVACKVNGKVQIYKGKENYLSGGEVYFIPQARGIGVDAIIRAGSNENGDVIRIHVVTSQIEINKEYAFNNENDKQWAYATYNKQISQDILFKTSEGSGYTKFTRYDGGIAAGEFEFTAYNDKGEKVTITEGFFDITFP